VEVGHRGIETRITSKDSMDHGARRARSDELSRYASKEMHCDPFYPPHEDVPSRKPPQGTGTLLGSSVKGTSMNK